MSYRWYLQWHMIYSTYIALSALVQHVKMTLGLVTQLQQGREMEVERERG